MKHIERSEILGLGEYEAIRDQFRTRVILEKRIRRVQLGPHVTALFENRDTVLLQIQEMLRTERITREGAIQHEIDTYNALIPQNNELSTTVMIEIPDPEARTSFLASAVGFESYIAIAIDGHIVRAHSSQKPDSRVDTTRTTAVHYLKFALSDSEAKQLRNATSYSQRDIAFELIADHPVYQARTRLWAAAVASIAADVE